MTISIRSRLVHEPSAGDGIRAFIVSSRVGLLASTSIHAKTAEMPVDSLTVESGETIDFLVDIGEGLNSDQFLWDIQLSETGENRENPPLTWQSTSDFPAGQVNPLTAWEQLAQALLCSNEFLFID